MNCSMGAKQWLQRLQPASLYAVLAMSTAHFVAQVVMCHVTHSLTLLVDSCHMLCNIIALVGCMMTLRYESKTPPQIDRQNSENSDDKGDSNGSDQDICNKECNNEKPLTTKASIGRQLKNTFGWARIEVLMMLIVCIFFLSLSYSVLVEALQTLIHIDHKPPVIYPLMIVTMGGIGLLLNGLCYALIGGYTFHHGSFLHVTTTGEVVLDSVATVDSVKKGQRRLSHLRRSNLPKPKFNQRESVGEIARDIISCLFVILCGLVVYSVDIEIGMFIDPAFTIISALTLLTLTYPYMKESCLILLQTIPDTMNIEELRTELLKSFPEILNIHDFHVWQLTTTKVILTMHIIFSDSGDYVKQSEAVKEFLLDQGITEITIQPEFASASSSEICLGTDCLMRCRGKGCDSKHCCNGKNNLTNGDLTAVSIVEEATEEKTTSCSG